MVDRVRCNPFEPVSDVTPALWFKRPGNNNGGDDELFAP